MTSELGRQDSGICQGCPLSPFLCIIVMILLLTDARALLSTKCKDELAKGELFDILYADDTVLYSSGPSLGTVLTNLQTSFNAIQLAFRGLQLLLNASKTKCMLFNRSLPAPRHPFSITTLDGSDLEYVDNNKYLGV